ncbi:class I SAM-dependent methyltransferase [Patescibacteria group bacterium]|nr:class I SAM-dependent methyltransferase [Patescibacteria group bacterium]
MLATRNFILDKCRKKRAEEIVALIKPHIVGSVLDIGAGHCYISSALSKEFPQVTPIDITNYSLTELTPLLFDGTTLPFEDCSYGTALLLFVLHHSDEPMVLLREALRVAGTVIIMEDVYTNMINKTTNMLFDSLINLDFFSHPHNYCSHDTWLDTFSMPGIFLNECKTGWSRYLCFFMYQGIYIITNSSPRPLLE